MEMALIGNFEFTDYKYWTLKWSPQMLIRFVLQLHNKTKVISILHF